MLIQVVLVAHAQSFLLEILKIIAFQFFETKEIYISSLGIEASEPMNVNFEAIGYDTSDSILNLGPIFGLMLIASALIILVFFLSKCCFCWIRAKNFFKNQHAKTFFNRITLFLDGTVLVLAVCCSININQVYKGVGQKNLSFYFSFSLIAAIFVYILSMLAYLLRKFKDLGTDALKNRVGAVYANLSISKGGHPVMAFWFCTFLRRAGIAYAITFGIFSLVAQLCFVNFSSLFMMAFIGLVRPYNSNAQNNLELLNEFTILIVYCHLIC